MSRNGSGVYSVPNTFSPGDVISSADTNENFTDLGDEITNSLALDGQSTMAGQLLAAAGTVAAPGITFSGDTDSGIYHIGANDFGVTVNGTLTLEFTTSGMALTGTYTGSAMTLSGLLTLSSTSHFLPPTGTTAQRPASQTAGRTRFNSTTNSLEVDNGTTWVALGTISALTTGFALINGIIQNGVSGNALTISIKGNDGNDPSAGNPVYIVVAGAGTGSWTLLSITAATSITVSSGSTMGTSNATPFRLWLVGFNDSGTFRLGVINCLSGKSIYPLAAFSFASSTAEGGAGAADSAQVFYTGTAVSSKPYQLLGYLSWESGLTTAGTWNAGATRIQPFGYGVPLPGQAVQVAENIDGAVASGSTALPNDDTIPQSGEGTQFMTQAITPSSAVNLLQVHHVGFYSANVATTGAVALFQDSTANALAVQSVAITGTSAFYTAILDWDMLAATTSATTFKIRVGDGGNTFTFNGAAGSRKYGGVISSVLRVTEIMA